MFSLWMRCCEHKGLSRSDHMVGNGDDRRARVREQHDSAESLREHEVSGTRALGVGASQGSCGVVGQQGDWVAPSAKLYRLREASTTCTESGCRIGPGQCFLGWLMKRETQKRGRPETRNAEDTRSP